MKKALYFRIIKISISRVNRGKSSQIARLGRMLTDFLEE